MAETKRTYRVEGFSCANCAGKFERNVNRLPEVETAKVNFGASKITVVGETTIEALEEAGAFEELKVIEEGKEKAEKKEVSQTEAWYQTYIIELFGLLLLTLGIVSYFINGEMNLVTILLILSSILTLGAHLLKVGVVNLRHFDFDMKTLMTVAVIGGALIGEWLEIGIVVMLFRVSERLEKYSMDKARQSIASLMEIAPKQAQIRRGDEDKIVPVDEIEINDVMVVKPGEKLAMDGIVLEGTSAVNQAAITGESIPQPKETGDEVFAGTLNEEGLLFVRVTKKVKDTTLQKIIHLVEEAQGERAPAQAFIDTFAKYYTPAIMFISLLVVLIPPLVFGLEFNTWLYQGLAVLVVGCPCALVVSTPISIVSAIGNAAKKGVLIKGGIHLETLGKVNAIAFDKTGTLTEGTPVVTDQIIVDQTFDQNYFASIIYHLEQNTTHPLAKALTKHTKTSANDELNVKNVQALTGRGVSAEVNGTEFVIESPRALIEEGQVDQVIQSSIEELEENGKTVVVLQTDQRLIGYLALQDPVRTSSRAVLEQLSALGVKSTVMLTGDNYRTGKAIAEATGIGDFRAELLPKDKLDVIKQLSKSHHRVAMVGDGINDAPALATADVGIAMGGAGTDTALETADIALMADDLAKLPFTIKLSRKALRIIKANISFSLLIKLVALLLVIPGWLTLWIAILSDIGATLIVSLNSMRLMRVKE